MATHLTDFREYRRGQTPSDWTLRGSASTTACAEGAACDLASRNAFRLVGGGARNVHSWNALDGDTGRENVETLTLIRWNGTTSTSRSIVQVRGSGTPTSETSYRAALNLTARTVIVQELTAGTNADLATSAAITGLSAGTWIWLRFQATGTTIRARAWVDGDTEPGTWSASATDATISAAGWVGLQSVAANETYDIAFFSVGTNGDAAPGESSLARTMEVWSRDPDVRVEFTGELEYYNPATDTVLTHWSTTRARGTTATDYPPSVPFHPTLRQPGSVAQRLEADALWGGQRLESAQQARFSNIWPMREFDEWVKSNGRSSAGYTFTVRAGEAGQNHRTFEVVYSATVAGEPQSEGEQASIALAPVSKMLEETLDVKRLVGIPTGVYMVTTTGVCSAPTNAAYNINSFAVMGRFRTSGIAGSGAALFSERWDGVTNKQWRIGFYQASHASAGKFGVSLSVGGGTSKTLIDGTGPSYADGLDHWAGIAVLDQSRAYFMVDGVVIGTVTLTATVDKPAQPFVIGSQSPSCLFLDWRMVNQFLTEDEMRAEMAARAGVSAKYVAMFRMDDNTGGTVTDYSTTANHGTLAGVNVTDRRWEPTGLGQPEQAGRPMPLAAGVLFNAPAPVVDVTRGMFRFNDGALPSGTALTVKAKGLALTGGGTDYTDLGTGVADMVGAQSEPVTFDLNASASPESTAIQLPIVARDLLVNRRAGTRANVDLDSFEALRKLLPMRGGAYWDEPPTVKAALDKLGAIGSHYGRDRHSRIAAGHLLPPVNPGHYGNDKVLEFLGYENRGVTFAPYSGYSLKQSADWSLVALVKFSRIGIDPSISSSFTYFPSGMTIIDRAGASATGYYLGIDGRDGSVVFGAPGVTGNVTALNYLRCAHPFRANTWYVITGTHGGVQREILVNEADPLGTSTFATENTTGSMTDPASEPLRIGHGPRGTFCGAISYAIGSSNWRTSDDHTLMRSARPTLNGAFGAVDRFHVALNDGKGDLALDLVASRYGRIEGARWCPRLTMDFRKRGEPRLAGVRPLRPAWKVDARYKKNFLPISGADVAATVSDANKNALQQPDLSAPVQSQEQRTDYRNAREIVLETPLQDGSHASSVAAAMRDRFTPNSRTAEVKAWGRDAMLLNLGDEVLLHANEFGLYDGVAYRVVSLAPNYEKLTVDIGLGLGLADDAVPPA